MENLLTLGIESSCDETAAAVASGRYSVLSSVVASQHDVHSKYGGVVPELACRRHSEVISPIVHEALERAGVSVNDIGLVAVTRGPGLVGALLVGVSYAKALAWARGIPLAGVNHLQGHVMSAFIEKPDTPLPMLALLVSGGHSELFMVERPGAVQRLGGTRDDAAGEVFDKVARMMDLGFPGGPAVERMARGGAAKFDIPIAHLHHGGEFDFSFSGPKTAVKNIVNKFQAKGEQVPAADICASFQKSVVEALAAKTKLAAERFNPGSLALVGGVACNGALRERFTKLGDSLGLPVIIPPPHLCSDNAAMTAAAGAGMYLDEPASPGWTDYLALDADPAWLP
ncbi:MAG: tRNA (adenosine(37)-N6)-threonylcarbamoyltransferase complex transferase subunit TsaD [Nitrospinae bacterium]|nr:tRNA (adenosine(37)-N6)-threonylcarbamoyltransferase complex transferase subunit TsaD [Nitrospinota bacterium]